MTITGSAKSRITTSLPADEEIPRLVEAPVKLKAFAEKGWLAKYATAPAGTPGRGGKTAPEEPALRARDASGSSLLKVKVKLPLLKVALVAFGLVAKKPAVRRSSGGKVSVSSEAIVSAVNAVKGRLLIISSADVTVTVTVALTLSVWLGETVRDAVWLGETVRDAVWLLVLVALALALALTLTLSVELGLEEGDELGLLLGLLLILGLEVGLRPEVGLMVFAAERLVLGELEAVALTLTLGDLEVVALELVLVEGLGE